MNIKQEYIELKLEKFRDAPVDEQVKMYLEMLRELVNKESAPKFGKTFKLSHDPYNPLAN